MARRAEKTESGLKISWDRGFAVLIDPAKDEEHDVQAIAWTQLQKRPGWDKERIAGSGLEEIDHTEMSGINYHGQAFYRLADVEALEAAAKPSKPVLVSTPIRKPTKQPSLTKSDSQWAAGVVLAQHKNVPSGQR